MSVLDVSLECDSCGRSSDCTVRGSNSGDVTIYIEPCDCNESDKMEELRADYREDLKKYELELDENEKEIKELKEKLKQMNKEKEN